MIESIPITSQGGQFVPHFRGLTRDAAEQMAEGNPQLAMVLFAASKNREPTLGVHSDVRLAVGVIGRYRPDESEQDLDVEFVRLTGGRQAIVILAIGIVIEVPPGINTFGGLKRHLERSLTAH